MFELLVVSILIIYFISKIVLRKDAKTPPGPVGLPILGYYPFLGKNPFAKLHRLSGKYEKIMKINLLNEDFYFLNSFECVYEAFVNKGENFVGRPTERFNMNVHVLTDKCIITSENKSWQVMHKFFLSTLSSLGMGKSEFESQIHSICDVLIKNIAARSGEAFDMHTYLLNAASNVISSMMYSKQYDHDDPEYIKLLEIANLLAKPGHYLDGMLNGNLFLLFKKIEHTTFYGVMEAKSKFESYFARILHDRINADTSDEYNDVVHYYLKEMKGAKSQIFNTETLIWNCVNLFIDGSETTAATLYLGLNLMARHTGIQRKVYNEIIEILGKDRLITMHDRQFLNYTRAVIAEIQRYYCAVPFGVLRVNHREDTIGGYKIPKRSNIVPNFWKFTRDKRFFKNPNNFDPNNFLRQNGTFVNQEASLPFSTGNRKCLGAKLAEMEIFIIFTTLMQKFEWKFANYEIPELKMIENLLRVCEPFKICAISR